MRTYSHALLTLAATRHWKPNDKTYAAGAFVGATIPDVPAGVGAVWLWVRRQKYSRGDFMTEVCGREVFRKPDAALHSALLVAAALLFYAKLGTKNPGLRRTVLPSLLGWTGHVASDTLTHGSDARPLLWPLSRWRFRSPISYREPGRYGRLFTIFEHAALFSAAWRMFRSEPRS